MAFPFLGTDGLPLGDLCRRPAEIGYAATSDSPHPHGILKTPQGQLRVRAPPLPVSAPALGTSPPRTTTAATTTPCATTTPR